MCRCRCRGLVATRLLALASKTSRADIWSFAYGGEHNVLLRHGCSIEKSVVRDVTRGSNRVFMSAYMGRRRLANEEHHSDKHSQAYVNFCIFSRFLATSGSSLETHINPGVYRQQTPNPLPCRLSSQPLCISDAGYIMILSLLSHSGLLQERAQETLYSSCTPKRNCEHHCD